MKKLLNPPTAAAAAVAPAAAAAAAAAGAKKKFRNVKTQGPMTYRRDYKTPRMLTVADGHWGAESD